MPFFCIEASVCTLIRGADAELNRHVVRTDTRAVQATLRTLSLMVLATAIALLIGWAYAYLSERLVRRGRWLWRLIPIAAISLPLFIHAAAWEATLGKFGWLPLSGVTARGSFFAGLVASSWIHGIAGAAWVALIVGAFLRRGPLPGEEAARLDAGPLRAALRVTLPGTYLLTLASGLWVALIAATEISVVDLYGFRTLADEVYFQYALSPQPIPILLAMLLPIVLCIGIVLLWLLGRRQILRPLGGATGRTQPSVVDNGLATEVFGLAGLAWLATLMILLPLVSLGIKAGWTVQAVDGELHSGWSAAQASATLTQAATMFRTEYYWTAMLAATAIAMTLPVSLVLSWLGRYRLGFVAIGCLVLLFIPGPVISMGIMRLFSQSGIAWLGELYDRSLIPAGLAVMHRSVPLCSLILIGSFYATDRRVDEAARIDGAGWWQRLRYIEMPRIAWPLAICGFVTAVVALGEVSATELVMPPGVSTVARRVFGLLHSGVRYQESGLCLIASSLVIAAVLFFHVCRSTMGRR
ncbi:Binding-protein-dependent transport system inner membrane component [Rosistilla ulvae]|uniref:Binding-protein-dependent transport system inner membrane component n=1 Tax=Rosistilla ulvae TaxID=1930277 RepID=A0A517LVT7_9BACT|nr:ABC transporter permease subunit [Rosistilla ulvae]QDS86728.1 Binding-protein-dependent transport system inner membrane component [Rosistilla ulvae]